jgi:dTDP-4-dehydrorhamnose 3,5-epimerase
MSIEGVYKTKLDIIPTQGGKVFHGFKNLSIEDKLDIQEVYFSTIKYKQIRGWKLHKKMTLNLVVPIGKVRISLIKDDIKQNDKLIKYEEILSQDPYFRLTIPPGIWFAFEGLDNGQNLVCNIADYLHDPDEVKRKEINFFKT